MSTVPRTVSYICIRFCYCFHYNFLYTFYTIWYISHLFLQNKYIELRQMAWSITPARGGKTRTQLPSRSSIHVDSISGLFHGHPGEQLSPGLSQCPVLLRGLPGSSRTLFLLFCASVELHTLAATPGRGELIGRWELRLATGAHIYVEGPGSHKGNQRCTDRLENSETCPPGV